MSEQLTRTRPQFCNTPNKENYDSTQIEDRLLWLAKQSPIRKGNHLPHSPKDKQKLTFTEKEVSSEGSEDSKIRVSSQSEVQEGDEVGAPSGGAEHNDSGLAVVRLGDNPDEKNSNESDISVNENDDDPLSDLSRSAERALKREKRQVDGSIKEKLKDKTGKEALPKAVKRSKEHHRWANRSKKMKKDSAKRARKMSTGGVHGCREGRPLKTERSGKRPPCIESIRHEKNAQHCQDRPRCTCNDPPRPLCVCGRPISNGYLPLLLFALKRLIPEERRRGRPHSSDHRKHIVSKHNASVMQSSAPSHRSFQYKQHFSAGCKSRTHRRGNCLKDIQEDSSCRTVKREKKRNMQVRSCHSSSVPACYKRGPEHNHSKHSNATMKLVKSCRAHGKRMSRKSLRIASHRSRNGQHKCKGHHCINCCHCLKES